MSRFHFSIPNESSILVPVFEDSALIDSGRFCVLQILNYLFFIVHSMWILLILFGWTHAVILRIHLTAILLTAFSWVLLGYWYGWGYCICTDWHWKIRSDLGIQDYTNNYVHLLILKSIGLNPSPETVNILVVGVFSACAVMSIVLNLRRYINRHRSN